MKKYDVIVIGGGPAGLAASISAKKDGANVCLIEREAKLGGILKQCIHDGFGLIKFKEKLSGPEYADRYIKMFNELNIDSYLLTFVTRIEKTSGGFKLTLVNKEGLNYLETKALILATGCRERTSKQVSIHGDRPSGIYAAGNAQNYINILGQQVCKKAVILGSGDIGLIMARRLTLEGAKVIGVYEIMNVPSGLPRNIRQCLNDFDIPLHLSTTVTKVFGDKRVEKVEVAKVDENFKVIEDTREIIECDALIVSVGLIPENELAEKIGVEIDTKTKGPVLDKNYMTSVPGVFSCGNSFHVFDLVDYVSMSGEQCGSFASKYVKGELEKAERFNVVIPPKKAIDPSKFVCISCPNSCEMDVKNENGEISVSGNKCPKGKEFVINELSHPTRTIATSVKTTFKDMPVLPVRTNNEIPKDKIFDVMNEINKVVIDKHTNVGDVIISNVLGLNVDIIATNNC